MGRNKKNINTDDLSTQQSNSIKKNIKCTKSNKNTSSLSSQSQMSNSDNQSLSIIQDNNIINVVDLKKKEKMLYDVIHDFFKKCSQEEINKIIDIIEGKYIISLRFLDWFVTRYCYLYKTSITVDNIYNKEQDFNINISYKAQLKSFKKKCFDPFKRKNKFYYSFKESNLTNKNSPILTTLGQLNFFKWILSFDIIKYVENNFDIINDKIIYVNSFFKKNIIDNNTLSIISTDELKSKLSISDTNLSDVSSSYTNINTNYNHKVNTNLSNKKVLTKYLIVTRNIFVEL